MNDDSLAELLKTQKSLTEWLEDIKHSDAAALRREDNQKRERLNVLNELIGLPFDKPTQFEAIEMENRKPKFVKFLNEQGEELCALRLMPKKENLPKLRMRGKTIRGAYEWFKQQNIDPKDYRADFVPHAPDSSWATIFIVNQYGIQGEIIKGGHHQLTQGFHDSSPPSTFRFDFKKWQINPANRDALSHLKKLSEFIYVPNKNKQKALKDKLGASFNRGYLTGYFETTDSSMGTWFIDYSQALGNLYADLIMRTRPPISKAIVSGQTGCAGRVIGQVCIVDPDKLDINFPTDGVLVCSVTTPLYVPLMEKALAIVTDQGGVLSHAAIIARELGKPCIVGTGNATEKLKRYKTIVVNADQGIVTAPKSK